MEESTSKEKVLKKIRNALLYKTDNPFKHFEVDTPIFQPVKETLDVNFADVFTANGGVFIYCQSEVELTAALAGLTNECNWQNIHCNEPLIQFYLNSISVPYTSDNQEIGKTEVSIVTCSNLISQTGTIVFSSTYGRKIIAYPETLVVVAYTNQLVESMLDVLEIINQNKIQKNNPSQLVFLSGFNYINPTGNTLIKDGLGPKNVFLLLVEAN